jgi:hypothetical protein
MVFLPYNEYVVRWIKIPKLPSTEVRNYISYRLSRWFPGEIEDIKFEPVIASQNQQGMMPVLMASAVLINAIYTSYPRAKIGSIFTAFRNPAEAFARIVYINDYFECVVCKDAEWTIVGVGDSSQMNMQSLLQQCYQQVQKIQIICDRNKYQDFAELANDRCSILIYETALNSAFLKNAPEFKGEVPGKFSGKILAGISASAFFLMLNFTIFINAMHCDLAVTYYKGNLSNALKIAATREKYTSRLLETAAGTPEKAYPSVNPYRFLVALKTNINIPFKIQTLSLTLGSFAMEAETQNAIELLSQLSASTAFSDLRLAGVQLLPGGNGERFSLTGVFNDRP